jgi:ferritin
MKNDVIHLAKSVKLIRAGKSEGGELKDPTKRAAFASLFTPREANLPATVVSPAPAPATPEENTALANRSPSNGPASAESPDLISKATQTLMEAPVTRRKFLETSRNAVAAANQAPTISKLLKPTKIAEKIRPNNIGTIQNSLEEMFNHFEESGYDPSDPYEMMRDALSGYMKNNPDKPTLKNVKAAIDELHDPETWLKSYYDHMNLTPEEINHLSDNEHLQQLLDYHSENVLPDYGKHEWSELKDTAKEAMENHDIKKSEGGELELRRAKMAKERAGGQQLPPSVFMPDVPRQVRAEGGLIHKESGGRISREQQLFIDYLKKHYPDGIILHHETPGHEGQSIRKNRLQGGYGVFAAIDAPSNFVTSKDKTTTKFRVPASHYENISPDMGYGGDDEESTHNDPFIDFMNKHPDPKGAYVGTSYEEIPDRWVKEIKEDHDVGPKYFSDGGDVAPEINNPMSVFPKPQRMFPEGERPAGGQYLSMPDKSDMTGHKSAAASIGIGSDGKPYFNASKDAVDETGTSGKGNAVAKTNLFKQKAGWKWQDAPEGHESTSTIVSVEHRGKHYYALNAHFPKGVDLARYENSPSEPRLRPTTRGNVELGPEAGSILVRGKEHPVYHHVIVKANGGRIHKEDGGGLAARRAEAQAYIKELIEQRNQYTKGSPDYDFYTKQIAEQGKIVAQKAEPERSVGMGHNQPPEETAPEKLDRRYNELGLYSKAAEAARASKQDEMKLGEWAKFLKNQPGVKKEELEWGLKRLDNIKPFPVDGEPEEDPNEKKFSKDEIASAFEDESLEGYRKSVRSNSLKEKYEKRKDHYYTNWEANGYSDRPHAAVIAEELSEDPKAIEKYFLKFGYDKDVIDNIAYNFKRGRDYNDTYFQGKGYSDAQLKKQRTDWAANYWLDNHRTELRSLAKSESPKWTKYQLSEEKEGVEPLENYREIIPQYRPDEKERFTFETHFPEKNPLFSLRLGDRKTPDGKKILEVVEAQSDASQQGRGKFLNDETHQRLKEEMESFKDDHFNLTNQFEEASKKQAKLNDDLFLQIERSQGKQAALDAMYDNYPGTEYPKLAMKLDILLDKQQTAQENWIKSRDKLKNVIPEYPHVASSNAITNLMIKQILHEVAAGDYDGVTVNHGPTQAARWPSKEGEAVGKWYDTTFIPQLYNAMKSHDPETLHYGPQFVPRTLEDKNGNPVLDPKSNEPIDLWKTKGLSDATPTNKGFSVAKAPQRAREQAGFDYYFNDDIHGYGTRAPARLQFGRDVQNWHHQQQPDVHESPEAVRVTGNAIADYLEGNNIPLPKKDDMQQPMIEASPTAKTSILKNQTLYKRGGAVLPHDDPRREENLAAWHKGSHSSTKSENGTPKVFYHGGPQPDIKEFKSTWGDVAGFFSKNPGIAHKYATHKGSIYPVYIKAEKIFDSRNSRDVEELRKHGPTKGWPSDWGYEDHTDHVPLMKKAGFDAYIDYEEEDGEPQALVPFHSNQIKSAIGNKGTFDPSKPDINEARGGRIGYDYGGDVRTGDNPGGAADANRSAVTSPDADRNYNAGSGTQTAGPSGNNRPDNRPNDNRPDNSNDRFNIGGGGAPMPPQRGDDSFFGNMGGNIGSVLGGLALGPIGAIGGRYLGNQFNQPDNSRFEAKNDEFGNPVGNSGGWLDFLGNSGNPPAPMTSDNRRDPIVQPRKPRRRVLMPDGTYQEVEEYKSGGEVKSPIAKNTKTEHNSPIVEVALSKIRSLPRGSDYPSRGMRGRP